MDSVSPLLNIPKENFQDVTSFLALTDLSSLGQGNNRTDRLVTEFVRRRHNEIFDFIQEINKKKPPLRRVSSFVLRRIREMINSQKLSEVIQAHHNMNYIWLEIFSNGSSKVEKSND